MASVSHPLDVRYDKIELPKSRPVVTRVERYAARCACCGATTLASVPDGLEPGTPFSINVVANCDVPAFRACGELQAAEPADA